MSTDGFDLKEAHRRACERFGTLVHAIRDDQWSAPTPCTDWDVRALVNHLTYENLWTAPLMRGSTIADVGDRFEGDVLGDDPRRAWDAAASEAVSAVREVDLEQLVDLSRGPTPAREYAFELFTDHLIHAWDLARAIGADERIDADLAEVMYERMKPYEEQMNASGYFGSHVEPPPGADLQTRLLALFGRRA